MTVDTIIPLQKNTSITPKERESLALRPVKATDFDQLYQYRLQCGWGEARLKDHWQHPDRPLCIFYITISGEHRDIGMGGWILDAPDDRAIACRETNTVELTSLFIIPQYQSLGLGGAAIQLLEKCAIRLHGAKTITLDTMPYEVIEGEGLPRFDYTKPSKNYNWYIRRGYIPIGPPSPMYDWPQPTDPNFRIEGVQMRKAAFSVLGIASTRPISVQ